MIMGVGNLTLPGQQSVAAGGIVKVKGRLLSAVKIQNDFSLFIQRLIDGSRLRHKGSLIRRVSVCQRLLIHAHKLFVQRGLEFFHPICQHRADSQGADFTFRICGKGKAVDAACLRITENKLHLCRIDVSALHVADGLQRDLNKAKGHVGRIDFHKVSVVVGFHGQL